MLSSVSDMKNFVANDLKGLKQQHKSLTVRELISPKLFAEMIHATFSILSM